MTLPPVVVLSKEEVTLVMAKEVDVAPARSVFPVTVVEAMTVLPASVVEAAKRPFSAFNNPPIVEEAVTERAEVVAPTASRLVKRPSVEKRLVEVALVVVALKEIRLWSQEVEEAMNPAFVEVT